MFDRKVDDARIGYIDVTKNNTIQSSLDACPTKRCAYISCLGTSPSIPYLHDVCDGGYS